MTLLLRCVSAEIELRCHLGHAYIIYQTHRTLAVLQWLLVPPRQCLYTYYCCAIKTPILFVFWTDWRNSRINIQRIMYGLERWTTYVATRVLVWWFPELRRNEENKRKWHSSEPVNSSPPQYILLLYLLHDIANPCLLIQYHFKHRLRVSFDFLRSVDDVTIECWWRNDEIH